MRFSKLFIVGVIFFLLFAGLSAPAMAQTPEPTPSPTPAWQQAVQLTSGVTLLVERRVTYGEIAVVIAIGALLVAFIIFAAVRIPKLWI